MVGWQGKKGTVYNWFINVSVRLHWECGSVSRKQRVVHHSVFPRVLYKAPPPCNLASQCRLNDHIFQEKDVQLSHISNPVVSHFMNQSLGLWFFPLTIARALFFFIWIPEWDALSQNIFLKTHSSHGNKVFCLLRQIQEAIWTSCFYFFSFPDFTLESNAHTFASNWEIVTGTQSLDSGILSLS